MLEPVAPASGAEPVDEGIFIVLLVELLLLLAGEDEGEGCE